MPVELAHIAGAVRLTDLALGLDHVEEIALKRGDSGRVLTAVLQQQQAVVDLLVDGFGRNDTDDAAHAVEMLPEGV